MATGLLFCSSSASSSNQQTYIVEAHLNSRDVADFKRIVLRTKMVLPAFGENFDGIYLSGFSKPFSLQLLYYSVHDLLVTRHSSIF